MTPPEPTAPPLLDRRYLLPRAVLAAGLWAFLAFGLDPCLRGGVERAAGRLAGRRADVGAVRTGLFPPRLEVRGFALPDRDRPGRDLVRFDRLRVDLDAAALADRRLETTGGSLTGLTFGAARGSDAAALDPLTFPLLDPAELLPRCPGLTDARGALGDLPALLADRGPAAADALETVRLARRLRGEWAARFAALTDRGDGLSLRLKTLDETREAAADPRADPLARLAAVRELATQTAALLAGADALADEWPALADRAAADRTALAAARRRDAAKLRALAAAAQGDPDAAARALLGAAFSRRVTAVLAVTEWLRDRLGQDSSIGELWPPRRGVRVPFPVGAPRPAVLLNDVAVTGSLPTAGGPVAFAGTLTGLTSHPALFAGPLAGSFTAAAGTLSPGAGVGSGDIDSQIESPRFSVAFTHAAGGGEPVTDVDLRVVAAVPAGARVWVGGAPVGVSGADDDEPARVEWAARVRLTGRGDAAAVSGTVDLRLAGRLGVGEPAGGVATVDTKTVRAVNAAAAGLGPVGGTLHLSGTAARPDWRLETDAGARLLASLRTTAKDAADRSAARLLAAADAAEAELWADLSARWAAVRGAADAARFAARAVSGPRPAEWRETGGSMRRTAARPVGGGR